MAVNVLILSCYTWYVYLLDEAYYELVMYMCVTNHANKTSSIKRFTLCPWSWRVVGALINRETLSNGISNKIAKRKKSTLVQVTCNNVRYVLVKIVVVANSYKVGFVVNRCFFKKIAAMC